MILTLVTPPQYEPVSLDEAKDHLRVTASDDDVRITGYITAARKWVENYLGRALITQTWDKWLNQFPSSYPYTALYIEPETYHSEDNIIEIQKAPLQSVTSITYTDENGVDQTLSTSIYTVDTDTVGFILLTIRYGHPLAINEKQ